MPPPELALRSATVAILLLIGVVNLRDWRHRASGPYGGLLALSVAAVSIVEIAGRPLPAWLWPLQLFATGTSAMFWIWTGAVFVDEWRPSWRDVVAWLILPVLCEVGLYAWRPWFGTAENAVSLVFVLMAAWRIAVGLRGDLVERRRRLRPLLAGLAVLYSVGVLLMNLLGGGMGPAGASSRIVEAAVLAGLAAAFALVTLRVDRSLAAPLGVQARRPAPGEATEPPTANGGNNVDPTVDDEDHTRIAFTRDAAGKVSGLVLNPGPWEQKAAMIAAGPK